MIAPNISFDPEIDDFTSLFSSVFNRVEKQLELYDKVEAKFQDSLKFNEPKKLKLKMSKVRADIISSQNQTDLISKEMDSMNQWMFSLEEQKKSIMKIDDIEIPDEFILKFQTNSSMMKEFEHDLLFYLRNYINSYETPQVIRLKECFKRSIKAKIDRLEIFEQISDRFQQAEKKFLEADAESRNLTAECLKSDEALARFSTSEAYLLVQKAKRQKFLIEDWAKRKKEILDDIDTLNIELKMYKEDNKDKSSNSTIIRKSQEVDDAYSKAVSKWNEQIRLVEEDFKVSINHQQAMMKQLEKDLLSAKLQLLAAEKKKTMSEVRAMQASSNRFVSKFTSNRHSLNRKIEASFRKKALSFRDAVDLLRSLHDDELSSLKLTMDGVIEELREVLKMRKDYSDNSTSSYLKKIQDRIELIRATTETAKRRINMKNAEKDIELKAINKQLVTVQGVVNDFIEECSEYEKLHDQLEDKLREQSAKKNEYCMNLKKEIDEYQKFINTANFLIDRLNRKFEESEAKSTDQASGDKFLFSKSFKAKALKRSYSMYQFKKLTFDEIVDYRYQKPVESRNDYKPHSNISKDTQINIEINSIKTKEIEIPKTTENQHNLPTSQIIIADNKNGGKKFSSLTINNNLIDSNIKIQKQIQNESITIEKVNDTKPIQKVDDIKSIPEKVDNTNKISEKVDDYPIQTKKEVISEPIENKNTIENSENAKKDNENEIESTDKDSSSSNHSSSQSFTTPRKDPLIPRPPIDLSPSPPAKRKIVTISSSAASLCGTISIIDPNQPEPQITERNVELNVDEVKNDKDDTKPSTVKIVKPTEIPKNSPKLPQIRSTADTCIKPSSASNSSTGSSLSNHALTNKNDSPSSSNNSSNNVNSIVINSSTSTDSCLPNTDNNNNKALIPATPNSPNASPISLKSVKLSQPPQVSSTSVSSSSSSSSLAVEKPKISLRVKGRLKLPEKASNRNSPSQNSINNDSYHYEKVVLRKSETQSEKSPLLSENEEASEESAVRTPIFKLDNLNESGRITNDDKLNGKIKIDYDKTLTLTPDKKKKKKVSISPRRKPPKQIPNEQPSFVNNRPPRHLTLTTSSILKNKSLHFTTNSSINVNIVNINESVSPSIPLNKTYRSRFDNDSESLHQTIDNSGNDTGEDENELKEKKSVRKKSKKLNVKKKLKGNDENFLKRKKIIDQKINGKILAFSLPTAERRALSVKNTTGKGAVDVLMNNGSLNLNNRINGSIISVQHF